MKEEDLKQFIKNYKEDDFRAFKALFYSFGYHMAEHREVIQTLLKTANEEFK